MSTAEAQPKLELGPRGADRSAPRTVPNRFADPAFKWFTVACGAALAATMAATAWVLADESWLSIQTFGFSFLWSDAWNYAKQDFGALTSLYGTVVSSLIALVIAVPLALAIAFLLVELVHPRLARVVGTAIEMLAAIPSIIYGMWGLFVFSPFLADHVEPWLADNLGFLPFFQGPQIGFGMLAAGLILAVMILPFIAAITRDVLGMVPAVLKEAAYGMGSTKWEVTRKVAMRYSLRGIVGASFLGLGRALGETMAVTFVIGNAHNISVSLFAPGNTFASTIANEFLEASSGSVHRSALVELGLVLFLITLLFQAVVHGWLRRVQRSVGERG